MSDAPVIQSDIDAAKRYLQGAGPWKLDEIGIGADDYLVKCFAQYRVSLIERITAIYDGGSSVDGLLCRNELAEFFEHQTLVCTAGVKR